jgi:hypothetical protein
MVVATDPRPTITMAAVGVATTTKLLLVGGSLASNIAFMAEKWFS